VITMEMSAPCVLRRAAPTGERFGIDRSTAEPVGNILGGIAIQTVALGPGHDRSGPPLTYQAASLTLVLEAAAVIAVLVLVVMGSRLPGSWVSGAGALADDEPNRGRPCSLDRPDAREARRHHQVLCLAGQERVPALF